MVESQNLSDAQNTSRLLQFLADNATKTVAGFEGTTGGVKKAMRLLELRFGQPHMIAKACVDALFEGPNISKSDREGLREFVDCSRTLYETLKEMNALSEMNLSGLGKMSSKLPTVHQARWRDEVQWIRERGMLLSFKDLEEFIEKRADAVNGPIFERIGEKSRTTNVSGKRSSKGPPPSRTDGRVTTLATQLSLPAHPVRCMNCEASHRLADYDKFKSMTVGQRRIFVRSRKLPEEGTFRLPMLCQIEVQPVPTETSPPLTKRCVGLC